MSSENVLFSLRLEHAGGDEAQTYPNFPPHALWLTVDSKG